MPSDLLSFHRLTDHSRVIKNRRHPLLAWALSVAAVAVLTTLAVLSLATTRRGNIDDVFIVLVYVRHLVRDGGFYWNALDGPVEGFTSPLDILVKAAGALVLPSDSLQAAFWSTLAFHCLCGLALAFFIISARPATLGPSAVRLLALLAAASLATNAGLAFGSSFLLETPLFVLMALASMSITLQAGDAPTRQQRWLLVGALSLLALARPEGVVLATVCILFLLTTGGSGIGRRQILTAGGGLLLVLVALTVARRVYFGQWAPNTYYAKTSDMRWNEISDGARYLWGGARTTAGALLLGTLALGWPAAIVSMWRTEEIRRAFALTAVFGLTSIALVLGGGGDSYPGERFLALPYALSIGILAIAAIGLRTRLALIPVTVLVTVLIVQCRQIGSQWSEGNIYWHAWPIREESYACQRDAFRHLAAVVPTLSIAESDCQRCKYFSDATYVIDLHGINNRAIAHAPEAGPVIWGRYRHERGLEIGAPVWIWGFAWYNTRPMAEVPMATLVADASLVEAFAGYTDGVYPSVARQMIRDYVPASLPICGHYFNFLVRRDHAPLLEGSDVQIGQ